MAEHEIPELDRKGLREFGLVTGTIVAVLFGLFFPWFLERPIPRWPWVIFGVLVVLGLAAPMALNPIYKTWMRFGLIMSKIMTPLVMGILFYVVITPIGFLLKLLSKDMLHRTFDDTDSYRVQSKKAPAENLEKPY